MTVLDELKAIKYKYNFKPTEARKFVYTWGTETLLNLKIPEPYKIPWQIRNNQLSYNTLLVIDKTKKWLLSTNNHKQYNELCSSHEYLSNVYNFEIIRRLRIDGSVDTIQDILKQKNFYQMNLNMNMFYNGNVTFDCIKSGETEIKFESKAANKDVYSKHGFINYTLKRK